MRLEGPENLATMRLRAMFEASGGNFTCIVCTTAFLKAPKMAAYRKAWAPRTEMMKKWVPSENLAGYIVCVDCAELPEAEIFKKAEFHLTDKEKGDLFTPAKPIDDPGPHRRKGSRALGQDTRVVFGDGKR